MILATEYYPAPDSVALLVNERIRNHHPLMQKYAVRIGILFAQSDNGKPAVKLHGAACNATIKIVSHRDRVTKGYDAELVIAEKSWEGFTHRQRLALIAHELAHLELVMKKDKDTGTVSAQFDAGGRPKLKTRPGDWDAGDGFASIVAEFGADAVEYSNLRTCWNLADQARELGLPAPSATLLDVVEGEADGDEATGGGVGEGGSPGDAEREPIAEGDSRYYRGEPEHYPTNDERTRGI